MSRQISDHPIVTYPEHREVAFTFDGRELKGREGMPIASALLENGIRAFRYTPKNGEPRSLFCGIGQCTDCIMEIDGKLNVRACMTPARPGMTVRSQRGLVAVGGSDE